MIIVELRPPRAAEETCSLLLVPRRRVTYGDVRAVELFARKQLQFKSPQEPSRQTGAIMRQKHKPRGRAQTQTQTLTLTHTALALRARSSSSSIGMM